MENSINKQDTLKAFESMLKNARKSILDAPLCIALIDGIVPASDIPCVDRFIRQCYNEPDKDYCIMLALNHLLDGFGIETFTVDDSTVEYINMGDSYVDTILLLDGVLYFESMGDFIESRENAIDAMGDN